MANLDVQPKKKGSVLPWILAAIAAVLLLLFFAKGCNGGDDHLTTEHDTATTTVEPAPADHTTTASGNWDNVDMNSPAVNYEEITDKNIEVRGNDQYGIYGLGENVLFDKGSASIKKDAESNLQQIAASINKRYANGEVRIFGYTDSTGDANANQQLAQQRAAAVQNWLSTNGKISSDKVSLHAVGEANPTSSNATEEGRKENRRVKIVARAANAR